MAYPNTLHFRPREKAAAEGEKVKEIALRKECAEERKVSFRDILAERSSASKKRQHKIQQTAERLGKEYQVHFQSCSLLRVVLHCTWFSLWLSTFLPRATSHLLTPGLPTPFGHMSRLKFSTESWGSRIPSVVNKTKSVAS